MQHDFLKEMSMKYTVITGASSGIGKATAVKFAKQGHNLILVARRREKLEELAEKIKEKHSVEVICETADLTDNEQAYDFYEKCKTHDVDIWINNAGSGLQQKISEHDLHKAMDVIRLNIEATTILSTLYVQDNKNKPYTLINISSTAGYRIAKRLPIYSASKMYISAITETLYFEMEEAKLPLRAKVFAAGNTSSDFELVANGKALDMSSFKGNSCEEVADFIYEAYESDEPLAYVGDDFKLHFSEPRIPHSLNKATHPSMLER